MVRIPYLQTRQDYLIAFALLAAWALLFLPNLRTNPNWYGDESIVLEEAWTLIQGQPRYGSMTEDFISPNPHPPFYLFILGGFLKVLGNDIFSGRLLQVFVALGTGIILFWMGARLKGKNFGFLCVAAFLCYPEVVIHYRWVRGHPMQGMWILASLAFLVCYIQERRLRDVILAGLMCSLAVGSHYFAYPLMGIVVITAFIVNWKHVPAAIVSSGLFVGLFLLWFLVSRDDAVRDLLVRVSGASKQGFVSTNHSWIDQISRVYRCAAEFVFLTPTRSKSGVIGVDIWLTIAFLGVIFFPQARFRRWLIFWLLVLMVGVFKSRETVAMFLYQALGFIPLMAVGFAGAMVLISEWIGKFAPTLPRIARVAPAVVLIGAFGVISLDGSLNHFHTKVDYYTIHSWQDATAAMQYVDAHTTPEDFVVMPDQLFWLYKHERKAQLLQCSHYEYGIEENLTIGVPKEQYWFDSRLENAKYLVLAYAAADETSPSGIDAIFWSNYKGPRMLIERVQNEKWPIVFHQGVYMVLANPKFLPSKPQ
jgi:4-amino-4-deoxy-L-arabinose transferase-like glycosyltransferase